MKIVEIRQRTVPVGSAMRNAQIRYSTMTATALAIVTDETRGARPLVGLAFDSIGRYAHGGLLEERFIPRLLAADPADYAATDGGICPKRAWTVMMADEKPGGHGERPGAVGLLDAALHDLAARRADRPLWALLAADTPSRPAPASVPVYASGGHYRPGDDLTQLLDQIARTSDDGHRCFKIKAGGAPLAHDIARVETVLGSVGTDMGLALDANATPEPDRSLALFAAMEQFPLLWIEEPAAPLDFALLHKMAQGARIPIATGENLFSWDDTRNLLLYGGLRPQRDFVQVDVSLSYGLPEYRRILATMEAMGWARSACLPHAGHLFALHAVAGLGLGGFELAMDRTGLFGQLTAHLRLAEGHVLLPEAPGVGFEECPAFDAIFAPLLDGLAAPVLFASS